MRLGNMALNPFNPDEHGLIPMGLLVRVRELKDI